MKKILFNDRYGYEEVPILIPDNVKPKIYSELIPGKFYYHREIIPVNLLTEFNSYENIKGYERGQFIGFINGIPIFKTWCDFCGDMKRSMEKPAFMIYDALEIHEALGIDIFYRE